MNQKNHNVFSIIAVTLPPIQQSPTEPTDTKNGNTPNSVDKDGNLVLKEISNETKLKLCSKHSAPQSPYIPNIC
jgi:hypothetical protein